jgi:cold shock CspA family protein
MPQGIIEEISPAKGYGFIVDSESKVFIRFDVHGLSEELAIHDHVSYTLVELYPGRMAVNLKKINVICRSELYHNSDGRQNSTSSIGNGA